MRTLFLLNPAAGKQDCTAQLIPQIEAAARRAGLAPEEVTIHVTEYAGHARKLACAAAQQAAAEGVPLRLYTAGGDGTFMEAMTGVQGIPGAAVGCLPYGSGNDFLRTYGTKEEFADLDAQLAGGEVTIDLLQTNLGLSATICAAGLDAQVAYGIPKFRRIPLCGGEAAYLLSIVEQLCGRIGRTLTFTINDRGLPDVRHLQRQGVWRRLPGRAGGSARRRLAGCFHRPQGWAADHCQAAEHVQKWTPLRERPADRGGKTVFHLPPRKACVAPPGRRARAHRGHGGRRVRPLRRSDGSASAAGRPHPAAEACL